MSAMESLGPSRRALFRGQLLSRPVAIINDDCLAEAGIVCRSCGDACAASAIRFQPRIDCRRRPSSMKPPAPDAAIASAACPGEAITLGAARHGDVS